MFFDDDGKVCYMRHNGPAGITGGEIDIASGKLIHGEQPIWKGFEDIYCEAPHIYKISGMYYMLAAEGGTYRGHMITAARSDHPLGPYESCPYNPILTHRHIVYSNIDQTGHGDLVQAHDGTWWMVFLAIRKRNGWLRLTGREYDTSSHERPTVIVRRQQHIDCSISSYVEFHPKKEEEEAGIVVWQDEGHHYSIGITSKNGSRVVIVRKRVGEFVKESYEEIGDDGNVNLRVTADEHQYNFGYLLDDGVFKNMDSGLVRYISLEVAGNYSGMYVGLYTVGKGTNAYFDWFEYTEG